MSEKAVAIITARGGSKRIPKKNIKEFCGKPIIAYSIRAALDSGIFDEVMVSTDSEEIAEIARAYGAKVPFMRSAKTSDDFATTADVLMEVLERYQEILNGNMLEMKWKENYNKRSQDLEKMYHDAGQFYMYQVEAFVRLKGQMTESIVPVIIDEMEVQDIDNETDWKLAELKYQMIKMRNKE